MLHGIVPESSLTSAYRHVICVHRTMLEFELIEYTQNKPVCIHNDSFHAARLRI